RAGVRWRVLPQHQLGGGAEGAGGRAERSPAAEELAAQIANDSGVQIVDARQRDHMSRHVDLMAGATWRDPDRVEEWIAELTPDKPVAVYCAYGFDVGRNVTKTLIE